MPSRPQISLINIISANKLAVATNLVINTIEIALLALVPLFIGFAIDSLLANEFSDFYLLIVILISLIAMSVLRRVFDTRAYGHIRVKVLTELAEKNKSLAVSTLNARLSMGRELVDFLEESIPELLNATVQFSVSIIVLYFFDPILALAAFIASLLMMAIYSLFHRGFYALNGTLNKQTERQVSVLETKSPSQLLTHLTRLKRLEIKISDREAILYGSVFFVLLSVVAFNLWFATLTGEISAGKIFSIVSYSWEFVGAAIVLPITLQSWSRLSEITARINSFEQENNQPIADKQKTDNQ